MDAAELLVTWRFHDTPTSHNVAVALREVGDYQAPEGRTIMQVTVWPSDKRDRFTVQINCSSIPEDEDD